MNKKVIWLISKDASYLEARCLALSKVFAEHGYSVTVITASFHHGRKEYLYNDPITFIERLPGVTYVYLKAEPAYHSNGAARVFNFIDTCRKLKKYEPLIIERTGRPDFITASEDNPFMPETVYKAAKRLNAKFITELRDIWPLSLISVMGLSRWHPFVLLTSFLEKRAYRRSDAVVTSMPFAYRYIEKVAGVKKEKVFWMPNGIDTQEVDENLKSDKRLPADLDEYLSENWCGVFTGSIVKGECLDEIIDAWEYLKDTDIHLAIVGEGSYKTNIQSLITSKGLKNVKMFPAVDRTLVCKLLAKAGCCVCRVCSSSSRYDRLQYGLSANKLSDYLYSGKPVIFGCNYDNVVKEAGHFSIPSDDALAFAETVKAVRALDAEKLSELSSRGKDIIRREYDYRVIGEKYLAMLESL